MLTPEFIIKYFLLYLVHHRFYYHNFFDFFISKNFLSANYLIMSFKFKSKRTKHLFSGQLEEEPIGNDVK